MISKLCAIALACAALPVWAEMQALDDEGLSQVEGQGGVYLSGEFSVNKNGGVLWSTPTTANQAQWTADQRSCGRNGQIEVCGLRLGIRSEANGGWFVLDNIKGIFSFEGLTLRTRLINSGFGGDGAAFNQDVLELGLPNEMKFKNTTFSVAVANQGGWQNNKTYAPSFQQTNIFSGQIDGTVRVQGNVLIFPKN
ncbi:DUF6160 family protein [Atopomonas sediminilitoris]|uniref:DUF6160 family protein n=1 Tax=Atopomonas sediminilitoris TaxID=2919919 RepID=UPI001F4DE10C|nr:DUF6160 family protein [Atopomonas sediminilitoris]MCJ8170023.1 hypothetical protein [Atopomonas sediminilitoris]